MKRLLTFGIPSLVLALVAGCDNGNRVADESDDLLEQIESDAASSSAANGDPNKKAEDQSSVTNLMKDADFAKRVSELTEKAVSFEGEYRFTEAVATWQELISVVAKQHGGQSWQATNVRLALETARTKSGFNQSQLGSVELINQLQRKSAEELDKRDFGNAFNSSLKASELTQTLFGSESHLFGQMQVQLGRLAQVNSQDNMALSYYTTAMNILKTQMGGSHPNVENLNFLIAQLYQQAGRIDEAIGYYAQSVNLTRQTWGPGDILYASRCHELGVAYHAKKDYQQAEKYLLISRDIRSEKQGETHPQVAHSLRNLAVVYMDAGELVKARESFKKAIEIFLARFGQDNSFTVDAQLKLATVLSLLKEYPDAENVLGLVAAAQKKAMGQNNEEYAITLRKLVTIMCYQSKFEAAEPLIVHAYNVHKSKLGELNSETKLTTEVYAALLNRTDRQAAAQQLTSGIRQTNFEQDKN